MFNNAQVLDLRKETNFAVTLAGREVIDEHVGESCLPRPSPPGRAAGRAVEPVRTGLAIRRSSATARTLRSPAESPKDHAIERRTRTIDHRLARVVRTPRSAVRSMARRGSDQRPVACAGVGPTEADPPAPCGIRPIHARSSRDADVRLARTARELVIRDPASSSGSRATPHGLRRAFALASSPKI